ncbi:MAG: PEGA domain-containing protein [Lentisphaeria bacterium]
MKKITKIAFTLSALLFLGSCVQKNASNHSLAAQTKTPQPQSAQTQNTIINTTPQNTMVITQPQQAAITTASTQPVTKVMGKKEPIRAMIIVQNHLSNEYAKQLRGLEDILITELSNQNILAVNPYQITGNNANQVPRAENLPESSVQGLAQTLRTPYIITTTLNRINRYTTGIAPKQFQKYSLQLSLNIATADGASFAGKNTTIESSYLTPQQIQQNSTAILNDLLDSAATQSANWLALKLEKYDNIPKSTMQYITVSFTCNIPGTDIEIDGVAVGTTPIKDYKIMEGVHHLRASYPYCIPYERIANMSNNAQFNLVLEMSTTGIARWKDIELFKTTIQRIKDSGATDDAVRRLVAEGQSTYLKNSHFQWNGAIQALRVSNNDSKINKAYMDFSPEDRKRWNDENTLWDTAAQLHQAGAPDSIIQKVRKQGDYKDYKDAKFNWDKKQNTLHIESKHGKKFNIK